VLSYRDSVRCDRTTAVALTRRIYVSMPADGWLSPAQNALKWGVVRRIESLGYTAEIFN